MQDLRTEEFYKKFWQLFAEESMETLFVFDIEGNVVFANQRAVLETRHPADSKINISSIYPEVVEIKDSKAVWKIETNKIFHTEAYCRNKTCYAVDVKGLELNIDEKYYGAIVAVDKARQKELEGRWRRAKAESAATSKAKDEFLANITHELRTPLNGIKGLAENLFDAEPTREQSENLKIILSCCNNMISMVNDILDFTKMQSKTFALERRVFNLVRAIKETVELHRPEVVKKGLRFMFTLADNVPEYICGDEYRLKQILNNLFSNAVKFTAEGYITLNVSVTEIKEETTELFFTVMDTGIGIDAKDQSKLFGKFSQVDSSITRKYGGTGLGLSITRQLVEMMGGSIALESEKGKGSLFSFSIVVENAKEPEEAEEQIQLPKKMKVEVKKHVTDGEPDLVSNAQDDDYIRDMLEKIVLCMELEIWEKAENFSKLLKDKLMDGMQRQRAFKMLLAVRRRNVDEALMYAEQMSEEIKRKDK